MMMSAVHYDLFSFGINFRRVDNMRMNRQFESGTVIPDKVDYVGATARKVYFRLPPFER